MSKKELIAKILNKLSEEDLLDILGEEDEEQNTHTHTIQRRRGSGQNKRTKKKKTGKNKQRKKPSRPVRMDTSGNRPNKFDNFIQQVNLTKGEQKELKEAEKVDKVNKNRPKPDKRGSNMIDVECRSCGQEDTVSASIVLDPDRYKCNNCSASSGE